MQDRHLWKGSLSSEANTEDRCENISNKILYKYKHNLPLPQDQKSYWLNTIS
jgi:hypothetical protein